jgi:hypothetical protein
MSGIIYKLILNVFCLPFAFTVVKPQILFRLAKISKNPP